MTNVVNHAKYRLAAQDPELGQFLLNHSIVTASGCREWTRARNTGGYGVIRRNTFMLTVHRLAFWIFKGPIDSDLVIDHMCHNRACFEPSHLQLLTAVDNSKDQALSRQTHCKRGHPLWGDNLYRYKAGEGTRRACNTCMRENTRRYRAEAKALKASSAA